jgi:hypothetical protein
MKNISFRQGILAPTFLAGPPFLQKTTSAGDTVDLVISNSFTRPVKVTFAHYDANYLFEENTTVVSAWGGGGPNNGPLMTTTEAKWLYWDINLNTGARTFGWTNISPIIGDAPTGSITNGAHWFDMSVKTMKVYDATSPVPHWRDVIRVFAAKYEGGNFYPPYPLNVYSNSKWVNGSQVGLDVGTYPGLTIDDCVSGPIMFSAANGQPLRQGRNSKFVTTETVLVVSNYSGLNVKFDSAISIAQAEESIPAFYLVSMTGNRKIVLASCNNEFNFVSGIVVDNLYADDVGHVITSGVVRNEQWNWDDSQINKPLFCGPSGEVTLNPPITGVSQQIGFVYDRQSIYMHLFPPVRLHS